MDIMATTIGITLINLILIFGFGGLGIYTMILFIKALKIYIKKILKYFSVIFKIYIGGIFKSTNTYKKLYLKEWE